MKTLLIFLKLCEINAKKLLIYRGSFFISLILLFGWVLAYVTLIEVIFYHTSNLAGWSKGGVLLIMSFYYLMQNISDILFTDGVEDFSRSVRRGELDFKIIKPVPLRLLTFFSDMRFDHLGGLIPTVFLFIYAFHNLDFNINFVSFFAGLILCMLSVVLYFSIISIVASLAFWVEKNNAVHAIIYNVTQLSKYPRQIYKYVIAKIVTFGIPLALLATIPAEVATNYLNGYLPLFFVIITIVFYFLSRMFWLYGLKKYTSAN